MDDKMYRKKKVLKKWLVLSIKKSIIVFEIFVYFWKLVEDL